METTANDYRTTALPVNVNDGVSISLPVASVPTAVSTVSVVQQRKPRLHLLGLFHTITSLEFSHCAFTQKVLRFPKMMHLYGWLVTEYSNGVSESEADEKVMILTKDKLKSFVKKKDADSKEFFGDDANTGTEQYRLFEEILNREIFMRARPGDIICHPFGTVHRKLVELLPKCFHVETGIGYPDTMLAHRIFESYAWMHYHLGKEKSHGKNYNWVVPNYFDLDDWQVNLKPQGYVLYFGRIYDNKGLRTVVDVAER